ncbi:hypothetical protein [Paraburkholderia sp. J8-2]|uniref:hypothetical protein n=1 Tax=Paraburkholderia sp. J8-2 TaxID=2805440 RepID=UPI002AB7136D|nr:hypothetical protein [Paraburkholderia sp. J8-2]
MKTQTFGRYGRRPAHNAGLFAMLAAFLKLCFVAVKLTWAVLYFVTVKSGREYSKLSAKVAAARDVANAKRAVEAEVAAQRTTAATAKEAPAASAPKAERTVKREASSPSKLNDATDEAPAKVIRRASADHPSTMGKGYWARRDERSVAFQHHTEEIAGKKVLFSVYVEDGQISEIRRMHLGHPRVTLAPYMRSTAAGEKTAFSLTEAIAFTGREFANAKATRTRKKATSAAEKQTANGAAKATDQPAAPVQKAATQGDPSMYEPASQYEHAPMWMDVPCAEELDAQKASTATRAQSQRESRPQPQQAQASRTREPAPAPQRVPREAPAPAGATTVDGGWVEEEISYRGQKRHEGVVLRHGTTLQKPEKGEPFEIYAIDIRTKNGEELQFRGYQVEEFVKQHFVRAGDTITLKRGFQKAWRTKANGKTEHKTINHYDVHVVKRGRSK